MIKKKNLSRSASEEEWNICLNISAPRNKKVLKAEGHDGFGDICSLSSSFKNSFSASQEAQYRCAEKM